MSDIVPENWNKLSRLEKAKYFASVGDANTLISMIEEGVLDELPEAEQRKIVAQAYTESANRRDRLAAHGMYHRDVWKSKELSETVSTFSRNQRAKSLEILLNPQGKGLKVQLKEFSQPKK